MKQLPSFNGWRAFSILLVLGAHIAFTPGFPPQWSQFVLKAFDGVLGVRFFFTISGFLITWLMLKEEKEAGFTSLKNFYIRRSLRILPVYLAAIIVMASIQIAGISTQRGMVWLQLLTFTRNFQQTGHAECLVSTHFWSLAVEEQFYLVWPVVFVALARHRTMRIHFLVCMILISIGCKCIAVLGAYNRHLFFLFQDTSTLLFLDCLAYGCLGAMLLDAKTELLKQLFERCLWPVFLSCCLLIIAPEIAGLGTGLQSLAFFVLLLQSVVVPEFKPFRLLNHPWMVQIGILSYSLYIWQQLVFVLWPVPGLWFLTVPVTFVAAWFSFHFLEKPFFSLRSQFRTHGSTLKSA